MLALFHEVHRYRDSYDNGPLLLAATFKILLLAAVVFPQRRPDSPQLCRSPVPHLDKDPSALRQGCAPHLADASPRPVACIASTLAPADLPARRPSLFYAAVPRAYPLPPHRQAYSPRTMAEPSANSLAPTSAATANEPSRASAPPSAPVEKAPDDGSKLKTFLGVLRRYATPSTVGPVL
jgi:hypothetical protein